MPDVWRAPWKLKRNTLVLMPYFSSVTLISRNVTGTQSSRFRHSFDLWLIHAALSPAMIPNAMKGLERQQLLDDEHAGVAVLAISLVHALDILKICVYLPGAQRPRTRADCSHPGDWPRALRPSPPPLQIAWRQVALYQQAHTCYVFSNLVSTRRLLLL